MIDYSHTIGRYNKKTRLIGSQIKQVVEVITK